MNPIKFFSYFSSGEENYMNCTLPSINETRGANLTNMRVEGDVSITSRGVIKNSTIFGNLTVGGETVISDSSISGNLKSMGKISLINSRILGSCSGNTGGTFDNSTLENTTNLNGFFSAKDCILQDITINKSALSILTSSLARNIFFSPSANELNPVLKIQNGSQIGKVEFYPSVGVVQRDQSSTVQEVLNGSVLEN